MGFNEYNRRGGFCIRITNGYMRATITMTVGIAIGFFIGASFPILFDDNTLGRPPQIVLNAISVARDNVSTEAQKVDDPLQIFVKSNPRGTERLPPAIVVSESDLYPRRLYGSPSEDLPVKPKYLVTFTVGYNQKHNIDQAVKKFSENFTIMLFHYDGRTTEWDEFEWSKRAIHISVQKQTKWWYAKRFLHPDIVAAYDYIFFWDEDLGVEHFNAEEYIKIVRKHKLEISQPGLDPSSKKITFQITKKREGLEVHKEVDEKKERCNNIHLPPCVAFVEIMAPVFSRDVWRCVWHLIQNDLVHGWGLDFIYQGCVEHARERIGVVDAQWIVHQGLPSLVNRGKEKNGKVQWKGVKERCKNEWKMLQDRVLDAEKAYFKSIGVDLADHEAN